MLADLRDIVRERGGDLYAGGRAATIPGPGHSKTDRSLSLRLSDDGRVVFHSFANDPCRDIMQYLGLDAQHSQEANPAERQRLRRLREEEQRKRVAADRQLCATVWEQTEPLEGSLAEAYLWSRGLILDYCADVRFHPAAPRGKPRAEGMPPLPPPHPAMVALIRSREGHPMGLHVTFVAIDGTGKAFGDRSRLMFGQITGNALHLTPPGPELVIGEGIETCAAYHARTGLPTWSALSTSGMGGVEIPRGVRKLVIAADGDKGGMNAASGLAQRAVKVCDVQIDPAPDGEDWLDVWGRTNV